MTFRLGPGGLLGEAEGIADEIGDVLDFGDLVVVGQDDGVKLLLEDEDFARQGVELCAGHGPAHRDEISSRGLGFSQIDHDQKVNLAPGRRQ